VAAETAQEAQHVVFGMSIVNSAPTSVLFDSGASHSFIFAQSVARHGIPVHSMSNLVCLGEYEGYVSLSWRQFQDCGQGILCQFHSTGF
jgi:hypothetical protein